MHFNIKSLLAMLTALAVPQLAMAGDVDSDGTAWILTSTALVLFMTLPGLALVIGGFAERI